MKKININNAQDYIDWLKSGKKFVAEAPRLFDELLPELTRYLNDRLPEAINTIQRRNPSNLKRLLKRIAEYAQPDEMYQLMINSETLTTDRTFSSKYGQLLFYYGREHARIYTDKYSETLSTAQKKRNANPETKSLLPTQKEFWMRKGFSEEEAIQKVNDTQEKAQARAIAVYHEHRRDWHNVDFWTEKGYSLEDAKAEVEQRMNRCRDYSVHTLERMIERYGEVEGQKRWDVYTEKLRKNVNAMQEEGRFTYASKASLDFFTRLINRMNLDKEHVIMKHEDYGNIEFGITTDAGRCMYDFKYKNVIIEYNCTLWHYHPDHHDKYRWKDDPEKIKQRVELDEFKVEVATENGYNIFTVWDYNKIGVMLDQCEEFILANVKEV